MDPRLFRSRSFSAAIVGVFGTMVVLHGCFLLVPLLVERLQAGSAETSGLVLLGISALGAVAAPYGGRISDRLGRRRPAVAGTVAMAVGLALLWQLAPGASAILLAGMLAIVGFGMGLSGSSTGCRARSDRGGSGGDGRRHVLHGPISGRSCRASLAGWVLGDVVTGSGVSLGFGLLGVVAVGVAVVSFGLPGRRP